MGVYTVLSFFYSSIGNNSVDYLWLPSEFFELNPREIYIQEIYEIDKHNISDVEMYETRKE